MTSRDIRDRFDEALEAYSLNQNQGRILLQKLVTQLRDERNTLKHQLEEAHVRASLLEQETSASRARLQDARIELESLSQQVQNTRTALQRTTTEVATLTATLNEAPFIDAADIQVEVVDAFVKSSSITSESLNASLKKNLVESAIQMGHLALAEWASQLDTEGIIRMLHFAYSELAFWEGATGKVNIVHIRFQPKETEIQMSDESMNLIRENGGHRKDAAQALSELISRGLLTFHKGRVYRPSEVKRLHAEQH